ncbi:hypothetical protein PDJAM_G00250930 [Pangasius djambal]|uniref:Uncharacterized protein n=1 Tax=Pangasius djambal TaxID=1691987 RepID=A0ACC5YJ62_9TELE|nr:hypothetical protein [Pangasius djambal]
MEQFSNFPQLLQAERGPSKAMLCVLLLPIAAFLLRAEAAVGINNNNHHHHHNNNINNNNGNTADTDKWISDKDKYWSKFRDVSVPG